VLLRAGVLSGGLLARLPDSAGYLAPEGGAGVTAAPARSGARDAIRTLTKHSSAYMGGIAASLLLGFVSFPIFTRAFSVAEYGLIDLAQKGLLLGVAAAKLGLQNSAMRFYEPGAGYYTTFLVGVLGLAAAVGLIFMGGAVFFPPLSGIGGILAALLAIRAIASIVLCFYRAEGRPGAYNLGLLGTKAGTIAAVCLMIRLFLPTVRTFLLGCLTAEAVAAAVYLAGFGRRRLIRVGRFDTALMRTALTFGLPLIAYEMATLILDSGDRVLVHYMLGDNALGRYSVAYGLSSYLNELLVTPLRLAIIPIYVALWKDEGTAATSRFLETGLAGLCMVSALLVAGAALVANDGIGLLASAKYSGAGSLIPIVTAGLLVYTAHVFLSAGLLLAKRTGVMAVILIVSAAANLAINLVMIPAFGLTGAAISTLLSYVFCVGLLWRASNSAVPVRIPWRSVAVYLAAGALAYGAGNAVSGPNAILRILARGTTGVVVYCAIVALFDRNARGLLNNVLGRQPIGAEA
ncbi:MAG: polysaccharide biosynthesis C-terminal domain-containing protein, partial [Acidobacteriota bacterium]|nr:polysaccharide biosynthesis C-terminal domain-containing protein [Acidobacteriota bacterium]